VEDSRARSSQAKTHAVAMPSKFTSAGMRKKAPQPISLADVRVLVDPGGRAGRVHNVTTEAM